MAKIEASKRGVGRRRPATHEKIPQLSDAAQAVEMAVEPGPMMRTSQLTPRLACSGSRISWSRMVPETPVHVVRQRPAFETHPVRKPNYFLRDFLATARTFLPLPLMLKSSSFLPCLSAAASQRGFRPRPAQVSAGFSGLRYFGGTAPLGPPRTPLRPDPERCESLPSWF